MGKMKLFITYIIAVFIFIGTLYAQTPKWVSTEVQNRTAILENFTGIYGEFCPDGDRIANEILKAYPDKFIIINNHCGPYAIPEMDHPDLRTDEGNAIMSEAGVKGFPTGSINRSTKPWAMDRKLWKETAENIMNQPSIVNVFVKPEFDFNERRLTVEVEYYYTDDSPVAENYLTVMLLQNEIVGYQTSGSEYNPAFVTDDGLYRHNNVLRSVINGGAWGEVITNTKKGSYECRKYEVTFPKSIDDILDGLIEFENLEIVAFISESKSNIYTGHKADIEIPENIKINLTIEDLTEYHKTLKFEPFKQKIKITNNSELPITQFDMMCIFKNSQNYASCLNYFNGVLNKGESTIIEFCSIDKYTLKVGCAYTNEAYIYNIQSSDVSVIDVNKKDNKTKIDKVGLLENAFSEIELSFDFQNPVPTEGFVPPHSAFDYTLNPNFTIAQTDYGNAVLYYLDSTLNSVNKPGYIIFGEVNCKDNPNKILSYFYSYSDGRRNGTAPKIVTEISKDWGQTWERISEVTCKETGEPSDPNDLYIPSSGEYNFVQINLYDYVKDNFIIRIGGIPGTDGNALWIDDISLKNSEDESIKENIKLSVYPNPATNILHINNNNFIGAEYEIYDMSGKLIIKDINNSNIINVENLCSGTYSLKIKDSIFNFIKK